MTSVSRGATLFHSATPQFCRSFRAPRLGHRAQVPDRPAGGDRLGGLDYRLRVNAMAAVEVLPRPGLAEVLDPERARALAHDRAEPAERRRMAVDHRHD